MSYPQPDRSSDEYQEITKRFVEEAVSITQQLAAVVGKFSAPERPAVIRCAQAIYKDLLCRRASLALSPKSEWAVDLLLDGIGARLRILTDSAEN